jgi:hypothetical protein
MHFPITEGFVSWLAIWTRSVSLSCKIRIISSFGEEFVNNITVPSSGIFYLNVSELFYKSGMSKADSAIVQLESSAANLNANLYTHGIYYRTLSVDHLTGG